MPHPLDGCRLEVKRANEHIDDLQAEITHHFRSKPYKLRSKDDATRGHLVLHLTNRNRPSARTSILIGEVLQLRSALDHLVAQLVVRNGQQRVLLHTGPEEAFSGPCARTFDDLLHAVDQALTDPDVGRQKRDEARRLFHTHGPDSAANVASKIRDLAVQFRGRR